MRKPANAAARAAKPVPRRVPAGDLSTLAKALHVLDCFTPERRRLTLAEVIAQTGLPRATAHRFLRALAAYGLLDQDRARGDYRLGLKLFALGSIALANLDLHREAGPAIDRLTRLSGESVHLALFDGFNVVVVARRDGDASRRSVVTEIEQAPAHCTAVGKAALAFQPAEVVDRLCAAGLPRFTPTTITDAAALRAALQQIAWRGFAIDDGEHRPGVRCVGAPIRDAAGRVFAALSVTGAAARITARRANELGPLVVDAADAISRRLGWRGEG